jgi:hypothetical protein
MCFLFPYLLFLNLICFIVIHLVASVEDFQSIDFFSKWHWILDGWGVIVFLYVVDGDGVCHL